MVPTGQMSQGVIVGEAGGLEITWWQGWAGGKGWAGVRVAWRSPGGKVGQVARVGLVSGWPWLEQGK